MVAISLPKPEPEDWYGAPVEGPLAEPRPARPRRPAHPLPDRATRVRRRRLAALVAAVMVAVVLAGAVQLVAPLLGSSGGQAGSSTSGQGSAAPVEGEVYVVQSGDTLWTVAAAVAPDRDPRPVVDRLREANGGASLDVGDRLVIDLG